MFRIISSQNFCQLLHRQEVPYIIDVRDKFDFHSGHVRGAQSFPLDSLVPLQVAATLEAQGFQAGDQLFILCMRGMRARMAAQKLANVLPGEVIVVEGGTIACIEDGAPMNDRVA